MSGTIFIGFRDEGSPGTYRIAGHLVVIRPRLPALDRFRADSDTDTRRFAADSAWTFVADPGWGAPPFRRRVRGSVAGRDRWMECRAWPDGRYGLAIEGIGSFRIVPYGSSTMIATDLPVSDLSMAAIFGPALALTLARRNVWILHASAVVREGEVQAFLGASEAGKSTLAEYLASRSGEGWSAVADDLLPVRLRHGVLEALPRYPQHRWSSREQSSTALPEVLPIAALYRLGGMDAAVRKPSRRTLTGRDAVETVVRQTLSAGLFDDVLLERHLEFCARVAEIASVWALDYPRTRALLPGVEKLLLDDAPESSESGVRRGSESRSEAEV